MVLAVIRAAIVDASGVAVDVDELALAETAAHVGDDTTHASDATRRANARQGGVPTSPEHEAVVALFRNRPTLAAEVLNILEQRKITSIVVVDRDRRVEGIVHLHDLWRTEMV